MKPKKLTSYYDLAMYESAALLPGLKESNCHSSDNETHATLTKMAGRNGVSHMRSMLLCKNILKLNKGVSEVLDHFSHSGASQVAMQEHRRAELEAKRARLAELKKAREDRQKAAAENVRRRESEVRS